MITRLYVMMLMVLLVLGALAQAQTFTTIYHFTGGGDGGYPYGGFVQDKAGNLYGTTSAGGASGLGTVFKVDTAGNENVLYSFSGSDGQWPYATVILDSKGDIFGTTYFGGSSNFGAVFKIDTTGKETVLHSFAGGTSDGCYPFQGLLLDKSGNLYGTTSACGHSNFGTIFKINKADKTTTLHHFAGASKDGAYPYHGHLVMDKAGNLYGLTASGGTVSGGALYRLDTKKKLKVLYSFAGGTSDGCYPYGSVTMDTAGNFYGTTGSCGTFSEGTVWKVSAKGKETVLHNFGSSDGCYPYAGVTRTAKGVLYGVTGACGANGYGLLYKLSPKGKITLLHSFDGSDGADPYSEVLRTADGTLFGTSFENGSYGYGTVWKYVP